MLKTKLLKPGLIKTNRQMLMFTSQRAWQCASPHGNATQSSASDVNATWIHLDLLKFYVQIDCNVANSRSVQICPFYRTSAPENYLWAIV